MGRLEECLSDSLGGSRGRKAIGRAVDVDGADLAAGERVCRLAFSAPVAGPEEVRAELVRAARAGRAALGAALGGPGDASTA